MSPADTSAESIFNLLAETAAKGERCPTGAAMRAHLVERGLMVVPRDKGAWSTWLALAGRIRVDVYGRNWRVVTILMGEHAGKKTAPCPHGGRPYLTIEKGSPSRTAIIRAREARRAMRQAAGWR